MSQQPTGPTATPPWGTPVGPTGTSTSPTAAETQVITPLTAPNPRPAGPTRGEVELRVTALHYAEKILGHQSFSNADDVKVTVLNTAKTLEHYLFTGNIV